MRRALAAALLVLTTAACSGGGGDQTTSYSAPDLGWINRLNSWYELHKKQGTKIVPVWNHTLQTKGDLGPLRAVLRPYRECTQSLRAKVGELNH